jgi:hypothetical protein
MERERMFCAENLLMIGSPNAHGLPELHHVCQSLVHLDEQGAELIVSGFDDNEYARNVVFYNGSRVFVEQWLHAFELRRRVSGSANESEKGAGKTSREGTLV